MDPDVADGGSIDEVGEGHGVEVLPHPFKDLDPNVLDHATPFAVLDLIEIRSDRSIDGS
jgi:hypothetical protein